jgi:hypothetical protein
MISLLAENALVPTKDHLVKASALAHVFRAHVIRAYLSVPLRVQHIFVHFLNVYQKLI